MVVKKANKDRIHFQKRKGMWTLPFEKPEKEQMGIIPPVETHKETDSSDGAPTAEKEPVRPSWKNMPVIAIIARRPLASSAFSLRLRVS